MATRERPIDRGRRLGRELGSRLIWELRRERVNADLSQRAVATVLGWSQARYWRFERDDDALLSEISAVAAVLGLDLSAGLHRTGEAITDRGQVALLNRFRALLAGTIQVVAEVLLPNIGDRRSWDLLLRIGRQIVGVEAETKVRDVQLTVRKIRGRERDGGADEIVLVLADTRANRAVVDDLLTALGLRFATPPQRLRAAFQAGTPIPGSGIILA